MDLAQTLDAVYTWVVGNLPDRGRRREFGAVVVLTVFVYHKLRHDPAGVWMREKLAAVGNGGSRPPGRESC